MNTTQAMTTVTALFLHSTEAKKALSALQRSGVAPENIAAGDATVIEREEVVEKEGFLHRIFSKKHNVPEEHRRRYEDHVRKGATVVAVAVDGSLVDKVVEILNYYGARDFTGDHLDTVHDPRESGSGGQEQGQARAQEAGGPPASEAPHRAATDVEPFSGQPIPGPEFEGELAEERRDPKWKSERRGGARVYSDLQAQATDDDLDRDFEAHHQRHFKDSERPYGQYAAAYRYGARAAERAELRDRSFEAAEPELERDFEAKGIGDEWAKVRDAVRYGWDRKRR